MVIGDTDCVINFAVVIRMHFFSENTFWKQCNFQSVKVKRGIVILKGISVSGESN